MVQRYRNVMLPVSAPHGAEVLRVERAFDASVAAVVETVGQPDYILEESEREVRLFYVHFDRLYVFQRGFGPNSRVAFDPHIPAFYSAQFTAGDQQRLATEKGSAPTTPPPIVLRVVRRIPLVIWNSEYQRGALLLTPTNDAADIGADLQKLGFRVSLLLNAKYRDMEEAIQRLAKELRGGDVGLLYFAGHGVQVAGGKFLIPSDAQLDTAADVKYRTVSMNWLLETMDGAENGLNVVVFDACRNNPFPQGHRGGLRGLGAPPQVRGALIAYSTSPNDVAADGTGRNSPYAKALLRHMQTPGLSIEQLFKQVRITVEQETNGRQIPWELSSLVADFYFVEH